ncbi:ABC transporter ATP-binding protein [Microbacterium sp. YY-03]|uniref:ABC transporter ATP-binding protein n=1 Tax=Microbacterium sp. YY-03 TaxID=3421636 RepID=UPI003D181D1F
MSNVNALSDAEVAAAEEEENAKQMELAMQSGEWAQGGKAKNFWPSFKRMIGVLAPYKWAFIFVSLLGAIGVVLSVWAPTVLGNATNVVFEGFLNTQLGSQVPAGTTQEQFVEMLRAAGQQEFANTIAKMNDFDPGAGIDFTKLRETIVFVMALYVFSAILGWVQGYVVNIVMVKAMFRLRAQIEEKINRLPLSYFDKVQRGQLISRVTNDVDNITQTMQQALSSAITSLLTVVGVLIMMFSISWLLALVALVSLPLMAVVFGIIGPRSQKAFKAQWGKVGALNARVEESFSGHALVKVFGREQAQIAAFQAENEELYQASFRAQFLSGIMMPAMTFIGSLTYVGIAVVGALQVAAGNLNIGNVQSFLQYEQMFTQPLSQLGGMATVVQSGTASAERVFELLDAEEQEPDAADAPALVEGAGVIEFENVAFAYTPDRPLIKNLSFRVEPGQTVAIVGPTGAGKTTLVNLLMRFYELDGGRILLDGQDIAKLTRDDVRSRTGMVLQDPWLFSGTIRENIRYGRESATDAEIVEAAVATRVDKFVHSLPDGYDTVLDEDASNVSAGERQLITIARAFVAQPTVLILDEATSSVDTRTELLLQHAMAALREGRTSFVIAHRLSTIRDADLILVMESGDIVEQGNHETLIAQHGAYWRLYQSQFEQAVDAETAEEQMAQSANPTESVEVVAEAAPEASEPSGNAEA